MVKVSVLKILKTLAAGFGVIVGMVAAIAGYIFLSVMLCKFMGWEEVGFIILMCLPFALSLAYNIGNKVIPD